MYALFLQVFLLHLAFSANVRRDAAQSLGLYDANDQVEELTIDNFDQYIYGSDRAWLIEFYNSWCGHCRNYAPVYKKVADYFKNFKQVFVIAAVDCANDINQPLCRDFEIMGYPTLRYFHENFVKGAKNLGENVVKSRIDDVGGNVKSFVNVIVEEQKIGRALQIPSMRSYDYSDTSKLFEVASSVNYLVLVLENATSFYGIEAIINYHKIPMINITYSPSSNVDLQNALQVNELPELIIFNRATRSVEYKSRLNNVEQIETFLKSKGIQLDPYKPQAQKIIQKPVAKPVEKSDSQELIDRIKLMGDVVFLADLETALRFSLRKEIPRTRLIDGEKLTAFKSYLRVISRYFPLNEKNKKLIQNLTDLTTKNSVNGIEVFNIMKASESVPNMWSTNNEWLRCIGSTPANRGYPCGLWTLFHYLTVAAAENHAENPKEVLEAMHGYIKNFFGCSDCSQHFQKMAIERKINEVNTLSGSIRWLWAAHNQVNKRLAGDPTEDPQFPKKQFPLGERCPECSYMNGTWNEDEVEKYLRQVYSLDNVRRMDSAALVRTKLEDFQTKNEVMGSLDLIPKHLFLLSTYLGYINAR